MKKTIAFILCFSLFGCINSYSVKLNSTTEKLNLQVKTPNGTQQLDTPAYVKVKSSDDIEVVVMNKCYDKNPIVFSSEEHKPSFMEIALNVISGRGMSFNPYLNVSPIRIKDCKTDAQLEEERLAKERQLEEERIERERRREEERIAQKRRREAQKLARIKAEVTRKAVKKGFKGYYGGIHGVLRAISRGMNISRAKRYLIWEAYTFDDYRWTVSSVVGKYVIYKHSGDDSPKLFALVKQPDKFYGPDTMLQGTFFKIEGKEKFVNGYDQTVEVIVMKDVKI